MYFKLSLDYYFNTTSIYYSFFDGLFSMLDIDKDSALKSLNIVPSSYRNQRSNLSVKNKSNIMALLDSFEYSDINKSMQEEYECLINKVYYSCYYRQSQKLKLLLACIDEKITENNILKPLLCLFKVFIVSNLFIKYSNVISIYC